jgi:hypothetical protein
MGAFGSKMDPGNLPIVEFRSLQQYAYLENLKDNVRVLVELMNKQPRAQLMARV